MSVSTDNSYTYTKEKNLLFNQTEDNGYGYGMGYNEYGYFLEQQDLSTCAMPRHRKPEGFPPAHTVWTTALKTHLYSQYHTMA